MADYYIDPRYIDPNAQGLDYGTSWANAWTDMTEKWRSDNFIINANLLQKLCFIFRSGNIISVRK